MNKFALVSVAVVASVGSANAQDLLFNFHESSVLSGDTPLGDSDGIVAQLGLLDTAANEVTFTLTNMSDPGTSQFLSGVFLNLDPFLDITGTTFDSPIRSIRFDQDAINAPAGNRFDAHVDLFRGARLRLNPGESVSFSVRGEGLSSQNFDALSLNGGFGAALRVQGLGPNADGSTWLTASPVPEPTTLAGLGIASLAYLRRRRQR